ncbi:MAG: preprotein translocase subunit YajC [Candidatus Nanopelagicales bacterium]|nr:preprotein translocase subunit YajC [Candidatus Nanopelagicales bacterium]
MDVLLLAIPLLLLAGLWFTMIRPLKQRQREAQAAQMAVHVGARVMTTAGIYGRVAWLDEQTMGLEVSDGVVVKYARAAVASVLDDEG